MAPRYDWAAVGGGGSGWRGTAVGGNGVASGMRLLWWPTTMEDMLQAWWSWWRASGATTGSDLLPQYYHIGHQVYPSSITILSDYHTLIQYCHAVQKLRLNTVATSGNDHTWVYLNTVAILGSAHTPVLNPHGGRWPNPTPVLPSLALISKSLTSS